jgi:hypothetical protein
VFYSVSLTDWRLPVKERYRCLFFLSRNIGKTEMRAIAIGLLLMVGIGSVVAQDALETGSKPEPVDPMVQAEDALKKRVANDQASETRDAKLNMLSQIMKFLDTEQKIGHISPERGKELEQIVIELLLPYGEFSAQQVREYSGVQRQGSVVRVLYVFVASGGAIALLIAIALYFRKKEVIEVAAYSISGCLLVGCIPSEFGITYFAQAFAGGVIFSIVFLTSINLRELKNASALGHAVLLLLWGGLAVMHRDTYMGFLATACLISMMGFVVIPFGGGYAIGFNGKENIQPASLASVGILIAGMLANTQSFDSKFTEWFVSPFVTGFLVLGALVSLIGYLILSVHFWAKSEDSYVTMNLIFLGLCLGMIFAGTAWNVPNVRGIAFTLGFFWVLDKTIEWNLGTWGWVYKLGGAAALGYVVVQYLQRHPELFQ